MIALSLPEPGHPFGWSVCGRELTSALKKLTGLLEVPVAGDYPEFYKMPLLHAIQGVNLLPLRPQYASVCDVGYTFVEDDILVKKYAINGMRYFDQIIAGSTWCEQILKDAGIENAGKAIIQGVGQEFFEVKPRPEDDRFIIFSGGKAELRKGQDLVIDAMIVFMERHKDAWLSFNWYNPWAKQMPENFMNTVKRFNKIDRMRVTGPQFQPNAHEGMATVYRYSDIGLFCSRAEAGNNMPMCEYMASGRPVIATYATGHKDVLDEADPFNLTHNGEYLNKAPDGSVTGIWVEPDLDEILAKLEYAYQGRDSLASKGASCRERMRQWTWERCAKELLAALATS